VPVNGSLGQAEGHWSCWSPSCFWPYALIKGNIYCALFFHCFLIEALLAGVCEWKGMSCWQLRLAILWADFVPSLSILKCDTGANMPSKIMGEVWLASCMFVYFSFISCIFFSLESAVTLSCVDLFYGRIWSLWQEDKKRKRSQIYLKSYCSKCSQKCRFLWLEEKGGIPRHCLTA